MSSCKIGSNPRLRQVYKRTITSQVNKHLVSGTSGLEARPTNGYHSSSYAVAFSGGTLMPSPGVLFQERRQWRIRDFACKVRDGRCCDHCNDLRHVFFRQPGLASGPESTYARFITLSDGRKSTQPAKGERGKATESRKQKTHFVASRPLYFRNRAEAEVAREM